MGNEVNRKKNVAAKSIVVNFFDVAADKFV
jgi:hypothetical protein